MRRTYIRPPVVETIFECILEPSESWGLIALATLSDALRANYPAEPTVISQGNLEFTAGDGGIASSFRMLPQSQRYQFVSADGLNLVRVSRESLSVHTLAPYSGWEIFRNTISQALIAYLDIVKPKEVKRVSLRYVNQVKLWTGNIELSEYFRVPLETPEGLDFTLSSFFLRYEAVRPDSVKLIQSFASVPGEVPAIILDLDVIRENSYKEPDLEQKLYGVIDSLREIEREVFEAAITDKLREVFDADNAP